MEIGAEQLSPKPSPALFHRSFLLHQPLLDSSTNYSHETAECDN